MNENEFKESLASLRQQIDALDDKIIALLVERVGLIDKVGELKRKLYPNQCPIRPGREAEMVRRIVGKFKETPFDTAGAAAMWRLLIGTSTCIESPLTVSVYAPGGNDAYYSLAREYFGPAPATARQPHVNRVIGDVVEGKAYIGILPVLAAGDGSAWWKSLMAEGTPKIFAHLPFFYQGTPNPSAPAAFAIARIAPEPTGDDVSLIVIDADHNVSQSRLQGLFAQSKAEARWIDITSPDHATRRHLLEINAFVTPEFMKPIADALGASLIKVYYLGAYAAPVKLTSSQPQASLPYAASYAQKTPA